MTTVARTIADLRWLVAERAATRVGFVPTMGALHEGHLSLMRRAHRKCDLVVVSLFVNPTQFNDRADFEAYPHDFDRDLAFARDAGVHLLFAPDTAEMYPATLTTTVDVGAPAAPLEGVARGAVHFRGVATVVAKLLNIVQPHVAYFGQKDAQQALVIRAMVRDLDFPVTIEICPTVRESDGMALSSRNVRLSSAARTQATALSRALFGIERAVARGERRTAPLLASGRDVLRAAGITSSAIDYLAAVDATTLAPVDEVVGETLVAVAATVGGVRLIDNVLVRP